MPQDLHVLILADMLIFSICMSADLSVAAFCLEPPCCASYVLWLLRCVYLISCYMYLVELPLLLYLSVPSNGNDIRI